MAAVRLSQSSQGIAGVPGREEEPEGRLRLADWSPVCRLCRWPLSVRVKECVDCSHLPLTAQGLSAQTHLPVSSPLLPRNQNYSVTHQTPVPRLLHPKLVTQPGYHLSFPSQPYSGGFGADAGTFWPLGSLGPEEER